MLELALQMTIFTETTVELPYRPGDAGPNLATDTGSEAAPHNSTTCNCRLEISRPHDLLPPPFYLTPVFFSPGSYRPILIIREFAGFLPTKVDKFEFQAPLVRTKKVARKQKLYYELKPAYAGFDSTHGHVTAKLRKNKLPWVPLTEPVEQPNWI
ncbi:hypothetical protein K435DRAFT_794327 [Dendrothele bispora CBS 962.96]|uniref:Uncharacterized protein n=1 Tax=Dendrothele bispora (strain CBS 962.96) TaxID=1314807 RepID=A0A4S8MCX8_DENBC|nr:hypothetical protein K435DRAFT_794327 [Dendrothele bispora CBS 962.96]